MAPAKRTRVVEDGPFSVDVEGGMFYVDVNFPNDAHGPRSANIGGVTIDELERIGKLIASAVSIERNRRRLMGVDEPKPRG